MSEGKHYEECLKELGADCEKSESARGYEVSLVVADTSNRLVRTRPIAMSACCAKAATQVGWEKLAPEISAHAPNQLQVCAVLVREVCKL